MNAEDRPWPLFTYEYQYQNAQWSFEIPAKDQADAEARMRAIRTTGVVSGEIMMDIPVPRPRSLVQAIRHFFS